MKTILRLSLVLCFIFISTQIEAKNPFGVSVKAGVNLSDYYSSKIENSSLKVGYNVGIAVDYRLSRNFYLLSGIEVTSKGTREKDDITQVYLDGFDFSSPTDMHRYECIWSPLYLQVPLHVGYVVKAAEGMNFLFHLGPYASYGIGGNVKWKIISHEGEVIDRVNADAFGKDGVLKRWDVGLGLGVGFEVKGIGVNLGYDLGFLRGNSAYKLKNNTAHVSFAYRFY